MATATSELWVLDTSVAIAWFFSDEPLRDGALAVRRRLGEEPERFVVPHLFYAELVHALARKSSRDQRLVSEGLSIVLAVGLRTLSLREPALARTAHWACRGLGGYDATFVALAEDLGARWITADERAARIAGRERAQTLRAWARS